MLTDYLTNAAVRGPRSVNHDICREANSKTSMKMMEWRSSLLDSCINQLLIIL